MGTCSVVVSNSYEEISFQGPGQTSLNKTLQRTLFSFWLRASPRGLHISSLRCCSTQPFSCASSILLPTTLLEYVLIPCLQQLLRFTKNLKVVIFSGKDLVQLYNSCWHWTNYFFHINLVPMQTICDLAISCMEREQNHGGKKFMQQAALSLCYLLQKWSVNYFSLLKHLNPLL